MKFTIIVKQFSLTRKIQCVVLHFITFHHTLVQLFLIVPLGYYTLLHFNLYVKFHGLMKTTLSKTCIFQYVVNSNKSNKKLANHWYCRFLELETNGL